MRGDHEKDIEDMITANKKAQTEYNQQLKDLRIKNEEDMTQQRREMTTLLERERSDNAEAMNQTV